MKKFFIQPTDIKTIFEDLQTIPEGIEIIGARKAWEKSQKGSGIVIAVIDSGCDINHPDLKDNIIGGYNFTNDDEGNKDIFKDYIGHGTHVSGIIAASDNDKGVVGVAPKSKLLVLKVIDKSRSGSYEQVVEAIRYAINWVGPNGEKVSVINMSIGGPHSDEELYEAIKQARKEGIILVAAAGNEGDGNKDSYEVSFPGFYKEVIQVGSVTESLKPSRFSNTNVNLDFVAPGENVLSTHLNGKYVELSGTSMAAPHVSGAIALILNMLELKRDSMTPNIVYLYLMEHAKKLGFSINEEGNGLIQLI
ncbi:S8 family peptidase [Geobacillus stearothermophilus]|nr:S8 family peptidase [Geobacillus stearothermophilus]MED4961133.1 S8 family peptidase [Geobacillus stearothermophilus]